MKTLHITTNGAGPHGRAVQISDETGQRIESTVKAVDIQLRPGEPNTAYLEVLSTFDLEVLPTECTVIDLCVACGEKKQRA